MTWLKQNLLYIVCVIIKVFCRRRGRGRRWGEVGVRWPNIKNEWRRAPKKWPIFFIGRQSYIFFISSPIFLLICILLVLSLVFEFVCVSPLLLESPATAHFEFSLFCVTLLWHFRERNNKKKTFKHIGFLFVLTIHFFNGQRPSLLYSSVVAVFVTPQIAAEIFWRTQKSRSKSLMFVDFVKNSKQKQRFLFGFLCFVFNRFSAICHWWLLWQLSLPLPSFLFSPILHFFHFFNNDFVKNNLKN